MGLKKLTRGLILVDLDRADRIDTALVKIGYGRGRLTSIMPKTKRGAKGQPKVHQVDKEAAN